MLLTAWIAIAALLIPNSIGVETRLKARTQITGSEYEHVQTLITRAFDASFIDPLVLVIDGLDRVGPSGFALDGLTGAIRSAAPRARVLSYADAHDPLFVGDDGTSTIVLIGIASGAPDRDAAMERIAHVAQAYVAAQAPSLRVSWTSESVISDELRAQSAREASAAELRILPFAFLTLIIVFSSVTAAMVPVAMGVLTVALSRGALSLIDQIVPLSFLSANVATMLGLGLSIDYSLLVVSRFREELTNSDARTAARATAKSAGVSVILAGWGFATALTALLVTPLSEVHSIAIAGLVVLVTSVLVSVTLLPVLLGVVGSRINTLGFFRQGLTSTSETLWNTWGQIVFRRPVLLLVIGAAPLLALAAQCARLDINLPRGDWMPASVQASEATHALARAGRTGLLQNILLVVQFDARENAVSETGQRELAALSSRIAADHRVAAVRSIRTAILQVGSIEGLGNATRDMFLTKDNRSALVIVVPRSELELNEVSDLVRDLRKAAPMAGLVSVSVGGPPALNADYADAVARWFAPVAEIILAATFMILAFGLRSVLLPLKAVALNLLSVAAALGAMTLVFQDGVGAPLLGMSGGYGGVFPVIPILVFAVVFGLSMDYEVFLFHRVVESHRNGASNPDAMTSGLRSTAGVITGAAALMIIVFAAFMQGEFLFMKMLGFSLAAAILIDSVVVRLVLGPALFAVAGRWNWWPYWSS